jgi:hypothetical protein
MMESVILNDADRKGKVRYPVSAVSKSNIKCIAMS